MENQVSKKVSITDEVLKVENFMVEKATKIKSFNELFGFYHSYMSVFLPTLEFAVSHLDEGSICQLANFGILIDHLSNNQIKILIKNNIDSSAKEISERTGQNSTTLIKMLDDLSISQKFQLSTTFLTLGSISRDATIKYASSKLNIKNKAILWANIFSNFFSFPVLTDMYIDEEVLSEAEKDLKEVKKLVSDKDRIYDAYFAAKWSGLNGLSEKNITEIPKYFIGTKLNWLCANEGLSFCRYLITKDIKHAEKALKFNEKIQKYLTNNRTSKSEWSYRNFNSIGPSPNLLKTLQTIQESNEGELQVKPISTTEWFVTIGKKCLIIDVPSGFNYYFSPETTVSYKDEKGNSFETIASEDIGTIINFGKNPADFAIKFITQLSSPSTSIDLNQAKYRERIINQYIKSEDELASHIEAIYNKTISSPVFELVKKGTTTTFESVLAYGMLISLEKLAEANGMSISSEIWIQIRTIVSGILVSRLGNVFAKQKEKAAEEEEEMKKNVESDEFQMLSSEEKIQELYSNISKSENEFKETFEEMKQDGLMDIFEVSNKIKGILLSGMSPEEIKSELEKFINI